MAERLSVRVCTSAQPGQVQEVALELGSGSTLADALAASGLPIASDAPCGVWGRAAQRSQVLRTGDRVEVYRALTADPKTARRERFARQGTRTAGLFAKKR